MESLSRRSFFKTSAASGIGLFLGTRGAFTFQTPSSRSFLTGIGICGSLEDAATIRAAGCDYIEESVRRLLLPDGPEDQSDAKLAELKTAALPVAACNGFLPGTLKAAGPEANHEAILAYAETALRRAARTGLEIIVWGSGESRRIPDGFTKAKAEEQFRGLAARVASLAAGSRVLIVLEPLQSSETNFINNLREGAAMVEAVGHPSFRLLADLYHMMRENETPKDIGRHGRLIRHCHVAEKDKRTPPGTTGDDFRPFLRALKDVGYRGRMSLECRWENLSREAPGAIAALRRQLEEIAA